jgi:hypothetical protein
MRLRSNIITAKSSTTNFKKTAIICELTKRNPSRSTQTSKSNAKENE